MKKYLLILSSLGVLIVFGFSGFVKIVKSGKTEGKKISNQKKLTSTFVLNRKFLSQEFEKKSNQQIAKPDKAYQEELLQSIASLPLMFQKNMGQWTGEVLYCASTPEARVAFRKEGLSFISFREAEENHDDDGGDGENNEDDEAGEAEELYEKMLWNLNFKEMNDDVEVVAQGEVAGVTNYLLGNDSTKWIRNTPECKMIRYKEIYNYIDLQYFGLVNHKLEYDYIIKPGGNTADIKMVLEGAGELTVNSSGELVITTPWGKVAEAKPFSYQVINGIKKEIDIRYKILNDSTFGFKAYEEYNKNYELVIDPKQLVWTTFVKGVQQNQYVQDVAIDGSRNSFITGWSDGDLEIKPAGVVQATFASSLDAFVCKFDRLGRQLLYCTYLGGNGEDHGLGIAVSLGGNAYVTGRMDSDDFPTAGSIYTSRQGGMDAFISALNNSGTAFTYSMCYGGSGEDKGTGIFVNTSNEAYVTGYSRAPANFPTTAGVVRPASAAISASYDAFVVKLNASGTVSFSTLLGGTAEDYGNAIFVSATGEVYVTGETGGGTVTNFILPGGYDVTHNTGKDAFIVKLNANATSILYSTFLGGSGDDIGYGIYERNGEIYVVGTTVSTNFPYSTGAFQTALGGGSDIFVTKLNAAGNALAYSTYIGGSANESAIDTFKGSDIVVNNYGQAYVSGITISPLFPIGSNGYDLTYEAKDEGFLLLLAEDGKTLLCASFMGGDADDYKRLSLAVDVSGGQDTIYAAITTHSGSVLDASPGKFAVAQTQGPVYNPYHINGTADEPAVFKMVGCRVVPLPVELISFIGRRKGDQNFLEWSTATETDNDYFKIERSTDGVNFHVIGMVDGAGSSKSVLNYSYSDSKEGSEIIYYRLKQTDFNGQINYSNIVAINAPDSSKALELTIVSPVTDHLNYKVCCLHKGDARVEVIDLSGRVVISTSVHVTEGYNNLTLDARIFSEGVYILKFIANNGTVSTKFIK